MVAQAAAARSRGFTRTRRARLGSRIIGSDAVRGRCARRGAVNGLGERRDQRGAAARRSVFGDVITLGQVPPVGTSALSLVGRPLVLVAIDLRFGFPLETSE